MKEFGTRGRLATHVKSTYWSYSSVIDAQDFAYWMKRMAKGLRTGRGVGTKVDRNKHIIARELTP